MLVQTTHLEYIKGKYGMENVYIKPRKFHKQLKDKNKVIVKKEVENPTCPHCGEKGHVEAKC